MTNYFTTFAETSRYATNREIRDYLGHGTGCRQVRISRDGQVTYRGGTDSFDRSQDTWMDGGHADSYRVSDECDVYYATIFYV